MTVCTLFRAHDQMAEQSREAAPDTFPGACRSLSQPKFLSMTLFISAGPPPATSCSATAIADMHAASPVCTAAAISTAATVVSGAAPGTGDGLENVVLLKVPAPLASTTPGGAQAKFS